MHVIYMPHASNSHTTHTIDGIVCVVWLLDACSIYIISILYPQFIRIGGYKKIQEFKICTPHYETRGTAPV